jgi:CBS domain-containing protein
MTVCPLCDFENIEGVDLCEQCGQPLADAHEPSPKNAVERGLLVDSIDCLSPKRPIVVDSQATVGQVLRMLVNHKIGCVFLVEGESIAGVFSERDALIRLGERAHELAHEPISKYMTPNPQTLTGQAKIAFAVQRMDLGGYRHIPIVDGEGRVLGVISVRDILRYLAEKIAIASSCEPG